LEATSYRSVSRRIRVDVRMQLGTRIHVRFTIAIDLDDRHPYNRHPMNAALNHEMICRNNGVDRAFRWRTGTLGSDTGGSKDPGIHRRLCQGWKKAATIKRYVATIARVHLAAGLLNPCWSE